MGKSDRRTVTVDLDQTSHYVESTRSLYIETLGRTVHSSCRGSFLVHSKMPCYELDPVARKPGPEVIFFSCSTQLSTEIILPIKVKMPTIVGILKLMSRINTTSECFKQEKGVHFQYYSFYEHAVKISCSIKLSAKIVLSASGLFLYGKNKYADQPTHPRSLISAF